MIQRLSGVGNSYFHIPIIRQNQNRQHVKCDQKTTLFALLGISPDESTQLAQKKNHVTLAIDCSGSMHGQKIEDVKKFGFRCETEPWIRYALYL